MRVAEDQRPPRADVVDVALAVGVPDARALRRASRKRGVPPTERKARTGELTPPGMVRWARANSSSLRLMVGSAGGVGKGGTERGARPASHARARRRAAASMSSAPNRAVITATAPRAGGDHGPALSQRDAADADHRQAEQRARLRATARADARTAPGLTRRGRGCRTRRSRRPAPPAHARGSRRRSRRRRRAPARRRARAPRPDRRRRGPHARRRPAPRRPARHRR